MYSVYSLTLHLIVVPKASRDRILEKEGRTAASFLLLRSNSLSQPGFGKLFISSLSEAVIVKRNPEAIVSEALPSYERTSWGVSRGELRVQKGNVSY